MLRLPPSSTLTDPLVPYTTLCRSMSASFARREHSPPLPCRRLVLDHIRGGNGRQSFGDLLFEPVEHALALVFLVRRAARHRARKRGEDEVAQKQQIGRAHV